MHARKRLTVTGRVQGVGFRPTVFRIAAEHELTGIVKNTPDGVVVEVQGHAESAGQFDVHLREGLPPLAEIVDLTVEEIECIEDEEGFSIIKSDPGQGHQVLISPDTATCADCLNELFAPDNHRYLYPFINCTNCGPRYTITRSIPYDRPVTSMACFPLCPDCTEEYENPLDRRFHAQPNACPVCGPQVWLQTADGERLDEGTDALRATAQALADGKVIAIKGLGGFHLAVDACNPDAVEKLRTRKNRRGKPLAVMVPDLDAARTLGSANEQEERWLTGIERPILLLEQKEDAPLAPGIAPDTDRVGVMLPYTPLHPVLFHMLREVAPAFPALVMTSGNLSADPICLGNREALKRLSGIADLFLLHNRDILIRTDDSVGRVDPETGDLQLFRRARGFTPAPVFLADSGPTVFGTGPELKNTMCITKGNQAFVSQHIGDMENLETLGFYGEIAEHLQNILQVTPELYVRDLHPDYMTSEWAQSKAPDTPDTPDTEVVTLQHHYAHIYSVLAENKHVGPAIGLALDGTGLGEDGTLWGGECLYVDTESLEQMRLAHIAPVLLPGGEAAIKEPWRTAQSYLFCLGIMEPIGREWPWLAEYEQASAFTTQMLSKNVNCPLTTSCGRLFDAVAALLGVKLAISYEGQAAIALEHIQDKSETTAYPCQILDGEPAILDTMGLFYAVYEDFEAGVPAPIISRRFHLGLAKGLGELAMAFAGATGIMEIGLSGGVMQNLTMTTQLRNELGRYGLTPLLHRHLPPNDACISLGQAAYGQRLLLERG